MDIHTARYWGMNSLSGSGNRERQIFRPSSTPALDSDCILEHILCKSRTFLMAHGEKKLTEEEERQFRYDITLRGTGFPVAYITGHKEFYGLDFVVSPDVLIPKPDTELLVEHAEQELLLQPNIGNYVPGNTDGHPYRIADICTGSGCIVISLLCSTAGRTGRPIIAAAGDISSAALAIARQNAERLLPDSLKHSVSFMEGDLFGPFDKAAAGNRTRRMFDLILSNPPYVPAIETDILLSDGRSEPRIALDGDAGCTESDGGFTIIRRLIPQAFIHLAPGGLFLVETGEYNAVRTAQLMKETGFSEVRTFRDLAGQLRLTQGRKTQT